MKRRNGKYLGRHFDVNFVMLFLYILCCALQRNALTIVIASHHHRNAVPAKCKMHDKQLHEMGEAKECEREGGGGGQKMAKATLLALLLLMLECWCSSRVGIVIAIKCGGYYFGFRNSQNFISHASADWTLKCVHLCISREYSGLSSEPFFFLNMFSVLNVATHRHTTHVYVIPTE